MDSTIGFFFNLFWCSPSKLLCCCLSVSQLVDTTTTSVHFNRRGCLNWNEICYTGYQYNIYVKLNFEKFQPNKCVFCNEPHTSILTVYTRFLLIFLKLNLNNFNFTEMTARYVINGLFMVHFIAERFSALLLFILIIFWAVFLDGPISGFVCGLNM